MLGIAPLLIIPFILYNLGLAGMFGGGDDPWAQEIFSLAMMSGGVFAMTLGDLMIVIGLVFLFLEIMKSTRTSNASVVDHLLSTFVFVAFLVEFLLVRGAAHSVFFILMVITLVDLIAGFSVSIRSAGRDVSFH
ncbi:hypothetical protein GN330_04085 [Nitratireductor sp. CAU 1489]|uniref:Transmembrane protein n=1 Tax=Nitratireductor arenosus TaxID=2682096 RepID=A0A844QCS3_9HYPH|nr:hypothetical protein [Nitratireductor arenosus]MVA96424.1 hypothetical protein [Nitratireductor arenosus]